MLGLPLRSSNPDLADKKYIAAMFASGEQGAWYDPSDLSTMYQDAAGTIPVTAVGQPVGKILDKSGRGNHATQSTTASRPTLSARVNLLTKTEQFNDAAWVKQASGTGVLPVVTANAVAAPNGTITAEQIVFNKGTGTVSLDQSNIRQVISTTLVTSHSIWLRADAPVTIVMRNPINNGAYFQVDVTTDWQRFVFTDPTKPASASIFEFGLRANVGVIVPDTATVYAWGASLVPADQASLPYQRVNTATDYDTAGFPYYLLFDGVDDAMQTGNIDFTSTDKMTVWAGVRKLSDVQYQMIVELSTSVIANNGSFCVMSTSGLSGVNADRIGVASRGTNTVTYDVRNKPASANYVLCVSTEISTDTLITRVNGTQVATSAGDQGTGNYGNFPLYIGRRNGASMPFNGRLYGLIVRGAQTDDLHLTHAEKYLAYKSGVSL